MKYMLIMQVNPTILNSLSEEERDEVMNGHGDFLKLIQESGEMISTHALAEPVGSIAVRRRDGVPVVTDGPYAEAKEYMGGYYLVECESRERAIELALLIPDSRINGLGIEVRPVIFSGGAEM